MARPETGLRLLRKRLPPDAFERFNVNVVRTLNEFHHASAVRAAIFMAEQDCPFEEEFDGNDFSATHLVGYERGRPIATLRVRWFAGFAKLERVCVLASHRGTAIVKLMLATCFELAAQKGYRLMIGQIQARLVPLWTTVFRFQRRVGRPALSFSNYDYVEIEIPLPEHPNVIAADADPYVIIREEGAWDDIGVLERSNFSEVDSKIDAA